MSDARGYRWGSVFFAFVLVGGLASLPYAITCCSRFSAEELAIREGFGNNGWAPGITPVSVALLNWPMGFRLLILTIVAAALCLASTVGLLILARSTARREPSTRARSWLAISQAVLGSFMGGVLYILAAYVTGYVGYIGPRNAIWFVGVPFFVSLILRPRVTNAILWTFPLLLGGWLSMAILSITAGIPLD